MPGTRNVAPCLPYAMRMGDAGVSSLSGAQASSLMRRFFSSLLLFIEIHELVHGATRTALSGFWSAWEELRPRSTSRSVSPLPVTGVAEISLNPARGDHIDRQTTAPCMLVTKISYDAQTPARGSQSDQLTRNHHVANLGTCTAHSCLQLHHVNVGIAEEAPGVSHLLFDGAFLHGSEAAIDPTANARAVHSGCSYEIDELQSLCESLLRTSNTISIGTWSPEGLHDAYEAMGADDTLRRLMYKDDSGIRLWLYELLVSELQMSTDCALSCACLYTWPCTVWRSLMCKAKDWEDDITLHATPSGQSGYALMHWVSCDVISINEAQSLLNSSGCSASLTTYLGADNIRRWFHAADNRCTRSCDCALQPIVQAAHSGVFGDLPRAAAITAARLRWDTGLVANTPLTREDIRRIDHTWHVCRLVWRSSDSHVYWHGCAPTSGQHILLVHETGPDRAPAGAVQAWGCTPRVVSALSPSPPRVCPEAPRTHPRSRHVVHAPSPVLGTQCAPMCLKRRRAENVVARVSPCNLRCKGKPCVRWSDDC